MKDKSFKINNIEYHHTKYDDLVGWATDYHIKAFYVYIKSCNQIINHNKVKELRQGELKYKPLKPNTEICNKALELYHNKATKFDNIKARIFFEDHFDAYKIIDNGNDQGLFTGYYEPEYQGSLIKSAEYSVPILSKPENHISLINIDKTKIKAASPNFPENLTAALYIDGKYQKIPDRAEIEAGALSNITKPILYLKSEIDAFFLHIQGSGRVRLDNGEVIRLTYSAKNGYPYTAIGSVILNKGYMKRSEINMQSLRRWLIENNHKSKTILHSNKSYIFFTINNELDEKDGPVGAQGIPLTEMHSLAIDRKLYAYGTPIFISSKIPDISKGGEISQISTSPTNKLKYKDFNHLMIAQDTGSAIKGAIRGDIFMGSGDHAALLAGPMASKGMAYILLPK